MELHEGLQRAVLQKVNRRVLPLFFCVSLLCQLDRSNLSFAALQMDDDLGFSKTIHGLGSGIFFIGYLAQLPANMVCVAIGARRWLACILVAWGCVAMCFATVRRVWQFLLLRFLLGVAESGAYPGIYFHLSQMYNSSYLGVAYSWVTTATAVAGLLGGPIAAGLMSLDGKLGLKGWQWLFLVEGAPPILLAVVLWLRLPGSPLAHGFLEPHESTWLCAWVRGRQSVELATLAHASSSPKMGEIEAASGQQQGQHLQHQLEDGEGGLVGKQMLASLPPEPCIGGPFPSASFSSSDTAGGTGSSSKSSMEVPQPSYSQDQRYSTSPNVQEGMHLLHGGRAAGGGSPGSKQSSKAGAAALEAGTVEADEAAGGASGAPEGGSLPKGALLAVLADWRVWKLGGIMFAVDVAMNASHFWIPSIIKSMLPATKTTPPPGGAQSGTTPAAELQAVVMSSLLTALPFAAAGVCMVANAYSCKRYGRRHLHTALPLGIAGCAFGTVPLLTAWLGMWPALLALTVAAGGVWATHGPLFSWPAAFLEQEAGALAFALMKTCGAFGGFTGPLVVGLLADKSGYGFAAAMLLLAGVCSGTAVAVAVSPPNLRGLGRLQAAWGWLQQQLQRRAYTALES